MRAAPDDAARPDTPSHRVIERRAEWGGGTDGPEVDTGGVDHPAPVWFLPLSP